MHKKKVVRDKLRRRHVLKRRSAEDAEAERFLESMENVDGPPAPHLAEPPVAEIIVFEEESGPDSTKMATSSEKAMGVGAAQKAYGLLTFHCGDSELQPEKVASKELPDNEWLGFCIQLPFGEIRVWQESSDRVIVHGPMDFIEFLDSQPSENQSHFINNCLNAVESEHRKKAS